MTEQDFSEWMHENTSLSDSSVGHYLQGLRTTSKDMLSLGVISKPLLEMNQIEYEIAVMEIMMNPQFIEKNTVGKRMYSNSLKHYQTCLKESSDNYLTEKTAVDLINSSNLSVTEKESIIKSRIGQGLFKKRLMEKYNGTCLITGISNQKILIASHIKPWSVSDNTERLDSENGLLMTPTYDKLFDLGLMSFEDNGDILLSKMLDTDTLGKLYLAKNQKYDLKISMRMKRNLEYHREMVFVG